MLTKTSLRLTIAAFGLATFNVSAQTPTGLNLQLYAGLSITGAADTVYSVEYVTDLTQTNIPSAWRCLEFLQLPKSPYLWADKSAPATGKRFYRAVQMQAPTNMVFIPPGTFAMGSPTNEVGRVVELPDREREGPQTTVTISHGYWMGKYEVTQGEYLAVMARNPSFYNGIQTVDPAGDYGSNLNRPVESVNWSDAEAYCAALTQRERAAGRIAANAAYRLPTEAEWEYACRAGTSTRFSYGNDPDYTNLANHAWFGKNSGRKTHPVGQKLSNPWGLHDMHGNVLEWCQDWAGVYPGGIVVDPKGPAARVPYRVFRGGCWSNEARLCRSACRNFAPDGWSSSTGFRVVLAPGPP